MEAAVYLRKTVPCSITEPIDFHTVMTEYQDDFLEKTETKKQIPDAIQNFMSIDANTFKELNNLCRVTLLMTAPPNVVFETETPPQGFKKDFKFIKVPDDCPLKSVAQTKKRTEIEEKMIRSSLRYLGEVDCSEFLAKDNSQKNATDLKPYNEYVFVIRVYNPAPKRFQVTSTRLPRQVVSQEFLVPSQLTLAAFRDRIVCPQDYHPFEGDCSDNPFSNTLYRFGEICKSSMFYIGNTFYVDCRSPNNIDYSEAIRKWGAMKDIIFDGVEPMENKKFDSLVARLGYPYLYMHQGSCEHLVVISDVRLLHPSDCLVLQSYPIILSYSILRGKMCILCGHRASKYLVVGFELIPYDNAYLCSFCLHRLCYKGATKVGDFKVYKYVDRIALL